MRRGSYFTLFCLALVISIGLTPVVAQDATPAPERGQSAETTASDESADATEAPVGIVEVAPTAFVQGGQLLKESFDQDESWQEYTNSNGVDFNVDSGSYAMHVPSAQSNNYYSGLNATLHSDVIIQARFSQASGDPDSAFGILCRSDENANGYYFLVAGDGNTYIGKATVADPTVRHLSPWILSPAVNTGAAENIIRAVCVADYLALYVNDKLVAQAHDSEFASGYAGLTTLSSANQDADVTVDNLTIDAAIPQMAASAGALPELKGVEAGALLLAEPFDTPDAWETYTLDDGTDLRVEDGVYSINAPSSIDPAFVWGQRASPQRDVIVNVTATLIKGPIGNAYGVMCRADPEDTSAGYYFSVSGDGYFALRGRNINGDNVEAIPLMDWTLSSIIHQGYASNELTVVCARDYLAFYVNGQLLADAHDSTFTSGELGLEVTLFERGEIDVSFDDLSVYAAQLS